MCNSKSDDEANEALEGQNMDEEESKLCSGPAKTFFFIMNILIWLGSCGLLAIGIYGLVDSKFAKNVTDGEAAYSIVIIFIIIGGIGFFISFIGCCGALRGSKCLVITYVIVLSLLLAIILIGIIIAFLYRNKIEAVVRDKMLLTLSRYNRNGNGEIEKSWDFMQQELECCGVSDYRDWGKNNTNFADNRVPSSCCRPPQQSGCENDVNRFYSSQDEGCKDKIIMLFEKYTPIVAGVAAGVALLMILGLCLGCLTLSRL